MIPLRYIHLSPTSAEKHLTGMPKARANPKSASFKSPFCKKKNVIYDKNRVEKKEECYIDKYHAERKKEEKKPFPLRESNPGRLGESQES